MRKILLGTTAVVGAALLGATGAQAQQAPTLRIGGYFEFNVAYTDDSYDRNAVTLPGVGGAPARTLRRDRWDFRQGDTEIHLFVTGKAANGLSYGFTMELQFDNLNNAGGAGTAIDTDEAYAFISSPTLGTLRLGDEDSAASLMQTRVPTVTGLGPDNMWDEFVARTADGDAPYLISGINDGNDSTKIIYLSPQFFGFDFGVSFAPNGREGEGFAAVNSGSLSQTAALQRDPNNSIRNELSGAIRYRGSFGNVGLATSFGAMRADAQDIANGATPLQDVSAYHLGAAVTAFGFTVGGEYNWGKYGGASVGRVPIATGLGNSNNWALGVTYTAGPIAVGGFYGQGKRDALGTLPDREQRNWGLGVAYTLAPGLELVASYINVRDENIATSNSVPAALAPVGNGSNQRDRDIDMVIVGTRIAF
jgi:predicted porin